MDLGFHLQRHIGIVILSDELVMNSLNTNNFEFNIEIPEQPFTYYKNICFGTVITSGCGLGYYGFKNSADSNLSWKSRLKWFLAGSCGIGVAIGSMAYCDFEQLYWKKRIDIAKLLTKSQK